MKFKKKTHLFFIDDSLPEYEECGLWEKILDIIDSYIILPFRCSVTIPIQCKFTGLRSKLKRTKLYIRTIWNGWDRQYLLLDLVRILLVETKSQFKEENTVESSLKATRIEKGIQALERLSENEYYSQIRKDLLTKHNLVVTRKATKNANGTITVELITNDEKKYSEVIRIALTKSEDCREIDKIILSEAIFTHLEEWD